MVDERQSSVHGRSMWAICRFGRLRSRRAAVKIGRGAAAVLTMRSCTRLLVVGVLLFAACGSHKHKADEPSPGPSASASTTDPRAAKAKTTTTGVAGTTLPTGSSSPVTVAPGDPHFVYPADRLALALLQNGDLPAPSQRQPVATNQWGGVCGSTPPSFPAPATAAAIEFTGPGMHVVENLADYERSGAGYLDAVRAKVACTTYVAADAPGGRATKVIPIPAAVVASGIDTRNGAVGVGVLTVSPQGGRTFHLWVRQGDLVIAVQDGERTATATSSVQLAQLALERVKETLA
jgi:hypothetical protein